MNKIILKADDYLVGADRSVNAVDNFYRFMKIIEENGAKVSLGVVGTTLHRIPKEVLEFTRERIGKSIELFNHSYAHKLGVSDITRCNNQVKDVFGITMETYGAQYNNITATSVNELKSLDEIKKVYMMHYSDFYPKMKTLKHVITVSGYAEVENFIKKPLSYIQWGNFVKHYSKKQEELKVYQLHPFYWSDDDFICFEEIIKLMSKDKKQFMFPSEI